MQPLNRSLLWAASCVFALGCSASVVAQDAPRQVSSDQQRIAQSEQSGSNAQLPPANAAASPAELPDSPGATLAKLQEAAPQPSDSTQTQAPASSPTASEQSGKEQPKLQRPVGTATAPAPAVSGVTAAQPAGVAIAPAKQHRVRTIILRTGAILGAAAAVGTVVALTEATPSKPPGAH